MIDKFNYIKMKNFIKNTMKTLKWPRSKTLTIPSASKNVEQQEH